MAASKATQQEIAEAVGLSVKTLARIYADELAKAAELIRRAVFDAQVRKAMDGHTPAARFVMGELKVEEAIAYLPQAREPATPKKGKKELRQEAADAVDGLFAPGPPPSKLVQH
ncbi:MAG: hypothetical protein ACOY5Y_07065 [Pseudomonadota bacterium]